MASNTARQILLIAALAAAPVLWAQTDSSSDMPWIRSVKIVFIAACEGGQNPVPIENILEQWRREGVMQVESYFSAQALDRAIDILTEMYAEHEIPVLVIHRSNGIPPRSMEIEFMVIERCNCKLTTGEDIQN